MQQDPLISVITISLNSAAFIQAAMDSVSQQDYDAIEYLVIDGGSTDGTAAIIEKNRELIDYHVIEPDNGLYHAMNKGIAQACGDVLFFLNSDDRFADASVVSDVAAIFRESNNIDFVYGNAMLEYPDRRVAWVPPPRISRRHLASGTICHQAIFARKRLLDLTGGFSEDYRIVGDYAWLLELAHDHEIESRYLDRDIAIIGTEGLSRSTVWEAERIEAMKKYYSPREIWCWRILPRTVKTLIRKVRAWYQRG